MLVKMTLWFDTDKRGGIDCSYAEMFENMSLLEDRYEEITEEDLPLFGDWIYDDDGKLIPQIKKLQRKWKIEKFKKVLTEK